MNLSDLLCAIHRKMQGVSEADVQAALQENQTCGTKGADTVFTFTWER